MHTQIPGVTISTHKLNIGIYRRHVQADLCVACVNHVRMYVHIVFARTSTTDTYVGVHTNVNVCTRESDGFERRSHDKKR